MAPLEGITGYVFRNAHYEYFHPADKYFTPFITPGLNSSLKSKALKDVLPENNHGPFIVPQILTNRADEFIYTEKQLGEMGYTEINLNLAVRRERSWPRAGVPVSWLFGISWMLFSMKSTARRR